MEKKDTIQSCLEAQHGDDPELVKELRGEIEDEFMRIVESGSYGDLEDLMMDNGIDGEGIEDLLFSMM
jgi:hypothetical protein